MECTSRTFRSATVRVSPAATRARPFSDGASAPSPPRALLTVAPLPPLDSQCLADADAMRAVTGPRVQLLCVDASPRLLVFGSSIGSVYVFERRARDGEALDADAEPDAANADAHDSSPVASLQRTALCGFSSGSWWRPSRAAPRPGR